MTIEIISMAQVIFSHLTGSYVMINFVAVIYIRSSDHSKNTPIYLIIINIICDNSDLIMCLLHIYPILYIFTTALPSRREQHNVNDIE